MSERVNELLQQALTIVRAGLETEGIDVTAIGLSLFLVEGGEQPITSEVSEFGGDLGAICEFSPDWPFFLAADLLAVGPVGVDGEEPSGRPH